MSTITGPVSIRVIFAGLQPGDPPQLNYYKLARNASGQEKLVSGLTPLRDEQLRMRLLKEIRAGEEILLTIETDWSHPELPSFIIAFAALPQQDKNAA